MADRSTNGACVSTGCVGAPVKTTQGSPYENPPPYSVCVPYQPAADSTYPGTHSALPVDPSAYPSNVVHHHGYVSGNILHNNTSGSPFNPQPPYNPSYVAHRQNDPLPTVYGRKTIVLQRTEAENIARRRQKIIAMFIILVISCVVPLAIFFIFLANHGNI